MRILPLTSNDIINRYQIKNNRLLDTFEDKVLKQGSNKVIYYLV